MANRSLNGMVKVVAYLGNPKVAEFGSQIEEENKIPQLYLLDPQGRLAGFVDYGDEDQIKSEAAQVAELVRWQSKSAKAIARADKEAASGKFKKALIAIAKIESQDRAATAVVARGLKEPTPTKPAARSKPASDSDEAAADAPAGQYFPGLLAEKREAYEKLAAERLAQAKAQLEKNRVAARKLLAQMVADGSDLEAVKEATALLAEIDNKPTKAAAAK